MSDPLRCAGCRATLHPHYARKYDGYCLGCANAGVPELRDEVAELRAQVAGHAGRTAAAVAGEREACAKVVEGFRTDTAGTVSHWGEALASAIRTRGQS